MDSTKQFYIGNLMYGRKENNINTGEVKINKEITIFKEITKH
ncbi:hypothetical protein [Leptotrichia hofstadii]|nr:hypothetical protein [Leptotrichia hofstadii]